MQVRAVSCPMACWSLNTRQLSRLFSILVSMLDAGLEEHLLLTLFQRNEELGFALLECAHDRNLSR